jgi:predicted AAA+ superfamily ATPase
LTQNGIIKPIGQGDYLDRVIDSELAEVFPHLGAVAIEGAKGVGKTTTAERLARRVLRLDQGPDSDLLRADPGILARPPFPILLDEWQRYRPSWDLVRRAVDADPSGGRYLLTGSAAPRGLPVHSGAGWIESLRLRPLTLPERGLEAPTVSLRALLEGGAGIGGATSVGLPQYVHEIVASGLPGVRRLPPRSRRLRLGSYLRRAVSHELVEEGILGRQPARMMNWLKAYAAATATTASWNAIARAASPGQADPVPRATAERYRDALSQLFLLDEVPAWSPRQSFAALATAPKHFLADPAFAAHLLELDETRLVEPVSAGGDGAVLGLLFEALAALSVVVFAQGAEAQVGHLRTAGGEHEVDFMVRRPGGAVVAVEAKLTAAPDAADARHLEWLAARMGAELTDRVILTTGPYAYRRGDGIAVVPLALFGP